MRVFFEFEYTTLEGTPMQVSDLVRNAGVERFDVDPDSLKSLGGTDGVVYACRRGNLGYVIKFTPLMEDVALVDERLRFIHYLVKNGVPIAAPLPSKQGSLYEQVAEKDQAYLVTLAPLADGRHPIPRNLYDWNERLFQIWGQVIGQMHRLSREYPWWEKPAQEGIAPTLLIDWRDEHRFFVDWCKEKKIVEQWMPFLDLFQGLPRDRSCYGLIHNDLHPMNFFYNPEARSTHPITIIDFDVSTYHWFFMDIAIAVYHAITHQNFKGIAERRAFARHFLSHFLSGYRQENDLDESWLAYLPDFTKYREILIYIALSNSWPEDQRHPWQKRFLAEKRARTLRGDPFL